MSFDLFKYLFSVGLIYIYGRLIIHYGEIFIRYMFNDAIIWKAKLERPRILFSLFGLIIMHMMYYARTATSHDNYAGQIIVIFSFSLGFYFSFISWTNQFQNNFLSSKPSSIVKKEQNFNLAISENQLQKLYNDLVRYDLLNFEKTGLQDFKNVLTKDWDEHDSKVYLKMDGPSCREFYEYLVKTFPNNTMTLKNLISSKLFLRPDGKFFKYNTLKNAPTKTAYSKNHIDLLQVFEKLV